MCSPSPSFSHRFLLFAGTTEGRLAAEYLAAVPSVFTRVCVATSYGRDLVFEGIAHSSHFQCSDQRIAEEEMEQLMKEQRPDLVIDATHPYAKEVTENIQRACQAAGISYLRVLREEGMSRTDEDVIQVSDLPAAVQFLSQTEGVILAATGSKELAEYCKIPQYRQRVFPRVLPLEGVVERCVSLGFSPKNLICMQGPFTEEMNTALLCQIQAKFLVTKDSGDAGGFGEKLRAARKAHCQIVVVQRPRQPEGVSLSQLFSLLSEEFGLPPAAPELMSASFTASSTAPQPVSAPNSAPETSDIGQEASKPVSASSVAPETSGIRQEAAKPVDAPSTSQERKSASQAVQESESFSVSPAEGLTIPREMDRFPLFVSIKDKRILVVGGGRIALRRIRTLLLFADQVQVVAEQPSKELLELAQRAGERLQIQSRSYRLGDCHQMELVVAATDSRKVNHNVFRECKELHVPVNVADCPEECSFYFPGVVKQGPLVVGVTAGGTDHTLAAKTVKQIRETLNGITEKERTWEEIKKP